MEKGVGKNVVLFIASVSAFLTPFMGSSVNVALPAIARELDMGAVSLSWVSTAYLLAAAMFLLPFGRLADIHGRKRIYAVGIASYTFFSFLCGISTSSFLLISLRVMQGVGAAMIFGTGVAILTSVYPANERGKALGINVASVYMGLSLGPLFGGVLTEQLGWRSIFFANVPFGLLILGLIFFKLKGEWAEAKGERFDLGGSLIYALSLLTIMYGVSRLPGKWGFFLLVLGLFFTLLFVFKETRIKNPLLDMRLLGSNHAFAFSNLAALINYMATSATGFLLSLYIQLIKGFSPQQAGLILVSQPLIQALFSPFAGRLSDRMEPRIIASSGMGITVLGLLSLIALDENGSVNLVLASLVLLGFGFALFSSPNTNAVMGSVDKKFYGVASATLGTMRTLGQMFSMAIVILIFVLYGMGDAKITPQYHSLFLSSMKMAFAVFALLCLGGIFASLARGNVHDDDTKKQQ